MSAEKSSHTNFEKGNIYHIYNRANGEAMLFYREENYSYLLAKYDEYLSKLLDTFAYCLLPNHFHVLIRPNASIKHQNKITIHELITEQFRRFFISFSQAINKQENRNGSLFQKSFKKRTITESDYYTQAVLYIHTNPGHHNLENNFQHYRRSSYKSIISKGKTKLCRNELLDWFGGRKNFIKIHREYQEVKLK